MDHSFARRVTNAAGPILLLSLAACAAGMPNAPRLPPPPDLPEPRLADPSLTCEELRQPEAVTRVPARYPRSVLPEHKNGEVLIEAVITEDGRVRDPRIVKATDPRFIDPAISALSSWRYRPATCDGVPVEMIFHILMRFSAY